MVSPGAEEHVAVREQVAVYGDVGQREGLSPASSHRTRFDCERERTCLCVCLVGRRDRPGVAVMEERRVVVVVGDPHVVLDRVLGLEDVGWKVGRVVLVVARRTAELHRESRPIRVALALDEHGAAVLQLIAGVPGALVLVAAKDRDERSGNDRSDWIAHPGAAARLGILRDVPCGSEIRHVGFSCVVDAGQYAIVEVPPGWGKLISMNPVSASYCQLVVFATGACSGTVRPSLVTPVGRRPRMWIISARGEAASDTEPDV